jgi:hypothetical protein
VEIRETRGPQGRPEPRELPGLDLTVIPEPQGRPELPGQVEQMELPGQVVVQSVPQAQAVKRVILVQPVVKAIPE